MKGFALTLPKGKVTAGPNLGVFVKLAYLVNTYPRASHSFIRREIAALERRGHQVLRLAMRSDRGALKDPADLAEDGRTAHLLEMGALRLGLRALGWMARHPGGAFRALRLALACGGRAEGGALLRHLEAHPSDERPLAELAAAFHSTERTISRRCRRELGMGFAEWRQRLRVVKALPRLAAGDKVEAIALDLGYASASAFIAMFRRLTGQTPDEHRRVV